MSNPDGPSSSTSLSPRPDGPPAIPGNLLQLCLKRGEARRLKAGHRWIFSNEIARILSPGGHHPAPKASLVPGALAAVVASNGRFLGVVHHNPATLIAARMLGGDSAPDTDTLERAWVAGMIREAAAKRAPLISAGREACRLVHSDADGLPGLVADRYGPVVSVQILTAGMERLRDSIFEALRSLDGVEHLYEAGRGRFREMEGLPERAGWVGDGKPEGGRVECSVALGADRPLRFAVDPERGQKTGEYLDQVDNRAWLAAELRREGRELEGLRVLDLFCYSGHWGVSLAMLGAQSTLVDSSAPALEAARANARLNGVAESCRFMEEDAFHAFELLREAGQSFDVVVVDPPAFAKTRKTAGAALSGYERLNVQALRIAAPGALVVTCSCSHHVDPASFSQMLGRAMQKARRKAWIVAERSQACDHPILMGMEETRYLKLVALRLLD